MCVVRPFAIVCDVVVVVSSDACDNIPRIQTTTFRNLDPVVTRRVTSSGTEAVSRCAGCNGKSPFELVGSDFRLREGEISRARMNPSILHES